MDTHSHKFSSNTNKRKPAVIRPVRKIKSRKVKIIRFNMASGSVLIKLVELLFVGL